MLLHVFFNEPIVQWGAFSLAASLAAGWLVIHGSVMWSERRRRRKARGFRTIKSTAQFQRERAQAARWRQPPAPEQVESWR